MGQMGIHARLAGVRPAESSLRDGAPRRAAPAACGACGTYAEALRAAPAQAWAIAHRLASHAESGRLDAGRVELVGVRSVAAAVVAAQPLGLERHVLLRHARVLIDLRHAWIAGAAEQESEEEWKRVLTRLPRDAWTRVLCPKTRSREASLLLSSRRQAAAHVPNS